MTPQLATFLFCFALAVVSFAILIPLEFALRKSNWTTLPKLGVANRRIEPQVKFDALRKKAFSHPDISVCDIDADRFLISSGTVRCLAERAACGNRTTLVFRYPLGLALFVVSVVAGVVLPIHIEAVNGGVYIWGLAFLALFMISLGSVFLLAFRSMANIDSDKLSYSLGLPLNAPDGFLFKRIPSSRKNPPPTNAQAETFVYRQTWLDDVTDNLFAVIFTPVLIAGMVYFASELDSGLFSYAFNAFIIIIGLVIWAFFLRYLVQNYQARGDFTFSVTRDFIACECPSTERGDSFKLSYQDIKEIRREAANYDSEQCVVIDRSGTTFEISYSYRNPVDRILDAIESVSPTTPIFEHGIPRHAYTPRLG